jgi:hypothetical protein
VTTMTRSLRPSVWKEVRALFPIWCAATVTVLAGLLTNSWTVRRGAAFASLLGLVTLGAHAFGHEYSHRTLAMLLTQPTDRRRLFAIKMAVLAAMVATLWTVAWYVGVHRRAFPRTADAELLLLAGASGLFLAPWLSMVSRSVMAGAVFSIGIPGLLAAGSGFVGSIVYGADQAADIDRFASIMFWYGMLAISAAAAFAGWHTFMNLQAIEGVGREVHLPVWAGATGVMAGSNRRSPIWLLIKKELRLQQLPFVIVGLYLVGWTAVFVLKKWSPAFEDFPIAPLTMFYLAALSMLIGSMASAEERHLGTLQWQVLQPVAAWKQWMIKSAVVLGLVIVLVLLLPAVLSQFDGTRRMFGGEIRTRLMIVVTLLMLSVLSLYLSSLCGTGVRALVFTIPAAVVAVAFIRIAGDLIDWALRDVWRPLMLLQFTPLVAREILFGGILLVLAGGLAALLLRCAFVNHRSIDRRPAQVFVQVIALLGFVACEFVVLAVLEAVLRA